MLNKILSALIVIGVIVAISVGLFFRQSYTNITAHANFMEDHFKVALWDLEIAPTLPEAMVNELPNSPIIIRAKSIGGEYTFKNILQHVEVQEVYQGEGLNKGEKITITNIGWGLFFDDMSANLNFINLMEPGEEYLIFLDGKLANPYESNVYLLPDLIIPPVFNYEDKEHVILDVPEDNPYVPYAKVKNNEFFVNSEEALDALMEAKHALLEKYPK